VGKLSSAMAFSIMLIDLETRAKDLKGWFKNSSDNIPIIVPTSGLHET
jgi:hypothetical protein